MFFKIDTFFYQKNLAKNNSPISIKVAFKAISLIKLLIGNFKQIKSINLSSLVSRFSSLEKLIFNFKANFNLLRSIDEKNIPKKLNLAHFFLRLMSYCPTDLIL